MISIVVIVKNDRKIARLLSKLKKPLERSNIEVVVIDASNGLLDDIKNTFSYTKTKWYQYKNKSNKNDTIPEQRNLGIKVSKGNIIVFVDSDCIPSDDWIGTLTAPIVNNKENIVAGKVIMSDPNSLHTLELERKGEPEYIDEAPTMNIAFTKRVFKTIGMFDTNFQIGEDVDLLWRARDYGFKIKYQKEAIVFHDLESFSREIKRMFKYGQARMKLYKKFNNRRREMTGDMIIYALYPLFFLFLPITYFIPIFPLLLLIPILMFHKRDPIKVVILKTFYGSGIVMEALKIFKL